METVATNYAEATNACARKDYLRCAEVFEEAYRLVPHPDALWNAAQAWAEAHENVRAANRYEQFLREAPPGAADRDVAIQRRNKLAQRLGRILLVASGATAITVDGAPLVGDRLFVVPGAHLIEALVGGRPLKKSVTVDSGSEISLTLMEEPRPEPALLPVVVATPAPAARASARVEAPPPLLTGGRRVVVIVGGAAAMVGAGLCVWSGLDTARARSDFDSARTPEALADGRARQTRTNALIVATASLGALTTGAAVIFATAARAPAEPRAAVSLGPGALMVTGNF